MGDEEQDALDMQENGEADADIPEEQAVEQQIVPFLGDDLAAAMTAAGMIYITLPGMCKALGLHIKGQTQRIKRTKALAKGLRRIVLATRGGSQRANCLRVDKVALWLGGVQTSTMKNAEFRGKIEAYQEELAPVATQVFMRVVGIRTAQVIPSTDPRVLALAEQIDTLIDVATFLREHMEAILEATGHVSMQLEQAVHLLEALASRQDVTEAQVARIDERTKKLTPAHEREVQAWVERIVRETEKRFPQTPLAYASLYGRIKTRFRVGSYKEIPDERFDQLITYLREELKKVTGGQLPEQGSLF
jgi:hypothetical protein